MAVLVGNGFASPRAWADSLFQRSSVRDKCFGALFSIPALLLYTSFMIAPIFFTAYFSFTEWSGAGPVKFIGLTNFTNMFRDSDFHIVAKNTGILLLLHLLIQIPVAVFFAYLLYRTREGFRFFRAVYFFPTVISATVIGLMFCVFLNGDVGPVNLLLRRLSLSPLAMNWLSDTRLVSLYRNNDDSMAIHRLPYVYKSSWHAVHFSRSCRKRDYRRS